MSARHDSSLRETLRLARPAQPLKATALIGRALGSCSTSRSATDTSPKGSAGQAVIEGSHRIPAGNPPATDRDAAGTRDKSESITEPAFPSSPFEAVRHGRLADFRVPDPAAPQQVPSTMRREGRFIAGSYTNPAGTRSYKLYVPSGHCGQPLPLVVMLHGCGQNPDDFAAGTRMNEFAEQESCLVLYPAQSSAANHSRCWNWFKPSDQHAEQGEPSLIAGMTRDVAARYKADPRRIYIAGLSAGGAMATIMAMTCPDLYAAACIHSGLPHAAAYDLTSALTAMQQGAKQTEHRTGLGHGRTPARSVPVIVFHGDCDTTVHPGNGDQVIVQFSPTASRLAARLKTEGHPDVKVEQGQMPKGHAYTRITYHHPGGLPHVEQWVIHGGGHAWSGGSSRGSFTDPQGPDATKEMMRFFLAHPFG